MTGARHASYRAIETDVAVVGQFARDLVIVVDRVPGAGESGTVLGRREMLGGKGADQAVALAQLGDPPSRCPYRAGRGRGRPVRAVALPGGSATVRSAKKTDVAAAAGVLTRARWLSPQLQQPPEAALAAASLAAGAGATVVLDRAPAGGENRDDLPRMADVVRSDTREAGLLTGTEITGEAGARRAAADIMRLGPSAVQGHRNQVRLTARVSVCWRTLRVRDCPS